MSNSAINQGVLSAKISNVQNVGDSSAVCSTTGDWSFKNATATATNVFISNAGNVGVGTTSPGAKLEVWKDNVRIGNDVTSGIYGLQWWRAGSERGRVALDASASLLELQADGEMRFLTAGENERMRIDASGSITLGTAGGSATHYVKGQLTIHNTANNYAFSINPNSSSGWLVSGTQVADAVGTYPLRWNSSTGVVSYTSSARQHKKDIEDLKSGLDKVLQLKPCSYVRKSTNEKELGLIADEVYSVLPEAAPLTKASFFGIEGDELIPAGVHYEMITPVLVKAIQELSAKVDAQAAEIEALKAS